MGPFLDEAHPGIQNGTVQIPNGPPTMESLFKHQISSRLRSIPDAQIMLIPHVRDIISSHAVWPQEAFSRQILDLPKNVRCLTNPAIFGLGEITIGVSTNDILRGISLEECTKFYPFSLKPGLTLRNPVNSGLYDRLPNYILQQRHFYPLFPPRKEARVAIQQSGLGEFLGGTPDLLILPSELQYFAKVFPC
jgi:DNA polymerase alpha subunit B